MSSSPEAPENPIKEKKVPPVKPSFKLQLDKVNQQQPSPVKVIIVEDECEKKPDEGKPD
jgi:hypothetical protein